MNKFTVKFNKEESIKLNDYMQSHIHNYGMTQEEAFKQLVLGVIVNSNLVSPDNLKCSYNYSGDFLEINLGHENSLTISNLLFNLYVKHQSKLIEKEKLPNFKKLDTSFKIKMKLDRSEHITSEDLIKAYKEDNLFIQEYFNSSKENIVYKLWKNNTKYQGFVEYIAKEVGEEEFSRLCQKFYRPVGSKVFQNKRFKLLKNNPYFINVFKEDNEILTSMIANIISSGQGWHEKEEMLDNIVFFIKENKLSLNADVIKIIFLENNKKSTVNQPKIKQLLLDLIKITKPKFSKREMTKVKLSLFPKRMLKKPIESVEMLSIYHDFFNGWGLDQLLKTVNISEDFVDKHLEEIYSKIVSKLDRQNFSLSLFTLLLEKGLEPPIEDLYRIMRSNSSLLREESFLNWYFDTVLKNKKEHSKYLLKHFRQENMYFQKFPSPYWFLNNGVISFDSWSGGKLFDIKELKYSKALELGSPEAFFKYANIKTKPVKKAIYRKLWDNRDRLNTALLDNILQIRMVHEFNEQKLLPFIEANYTKGVPVESLKFLKEYFKMSDDRFLNTLLRNDDSRSGRDFERFMVDTVQMIKTLENLKSASDNTESIKFINDGINKIKKDFKTFNNLHDMISRLATKAKQENFELGQREIIEHDKESFKYQDKIYHINIPKTNHELIEVGESLDICVGGGHYAQEIIKGNIFIFTIKENDKTIGCVEIDKSRRVRQARSFYNQTLPLLQGLKDINHPLVTKK